MSRWISLETQLLNFVKKTLTFNGDATSKSLSRYGIDRHRHRLCELLLSSSCHELVLRRRRLRYQRWHEQINNTITAECTYLNTGFGFRCEDEGDATTDGRPDGAGDRRGGDTDEERRRDTETRDGDAAASSRLQVQVNHTGPGMPYDDCKVVHWASSPMAESKAHKGHGRQCYWQVCWK